MILALALHGNVAGKRWRFVIKDANGSTLHSSRYCYQSRAEAMTAGEQHQARMAAYSYTGENK